MIGSLFLGSISVAGWCQSGFYAMVSTIGDKISGQKSPLPYPPLSMLTIKTQIT